MGGSGTNLLLALLLAAAGLLHTGERVDHSRDLPDRLTDREFRELIADFSEPPAKFIADNLVSNELSFAQVVPALRTSAARGGAFLGVGPEQNFTFIAAIQPRIAFVLDIQRENLLLHLLYKALFGVRVGSHDVCVASVFSSTIGCVDGIVYGRGDYGQRCGRPRGR